MDLRTPVTELPTVRGPVARGLARLRVRTVRDLLFFFPHRHEDRRAIVPVCDVRSDTTVVVRGVLRDVRAEQGFRRYRRGARRVVVTSARVEDTTGSLPVRWFHQPYLAQTYPEGTPVYLAGSVNAQGELLVPEVERDRPGRDPLHVARLVPVYPETAGVTSRLLRFLVSRALPLAAHLREYLPATVQETEGLVDFPVAVSDIHFPRDPAALSRARERLAFDELFLLQLAALVRKAARQAEVAPALPVSRDELSGVIAGLPFPLTPSQRDALDAILADCVRSIPMARLLAGDVGSGKTVVAGLVARAVAAVGGQTAFLAPTEILAVQHARTLTEHLGEAGFKVGLLTAAISPSERRRLFEASSAGAVHCLVGTHALLHAPLAFENLVLVVVDEQHRFGVLQRGELTRRGPQGATPHFLSLSATPIPRTLQLTAYGDVDVSPLDPRPGQREIHTEIVLPSARNTMYASIKNRIAAGGQVFVVCPRVEEAESGERRSVEAEYQRIQKDLFRGARIGRLHGKMRAEEKERVLAEFRTQELDLLVASTVIEVGVDVPGADTLLVEGAEHFGLATLHQLRGRIGRRGQDAICYLAVGTDDRDTCERLQVLVGTSDGLAIAEEDLRRRGAGELYGTRQHGGVTLKVASLADVRFLLRVRAAAERLFAADQSLQDSPALAARVRQLNVTTHFE